MGEGKWRLVRSGSDPVLLEMGRLCTPASCSGDGNILKKNKRIYNRVPTQMFLLNFLCCPCPTANSPCTNFSDLRPFCSQNRLDRHIPITIVFRNKKRKLHGNCCNIQNL